MQAIESTWRSPPLRWKAHVPRFTTYFQCFLMILSWRKWGCTPTYVTSWAPWFAPNAKNLWWQLHKSLQTGILLLLLVQELLLLIAIVVVAGSLRLLRLVQESSAYFAHSRVLGEVPPMERWSTSRSSEVPPAGAPPSGYAHKTRRRVT